MGFGLLRASAVAFCLGAIALAGCDDGSTVDPWCGDNDVNRSSEDCDGSDLNGTSCSDLEGFTGGTLACTDSCDFDTSGCTGDCTPDCDGMECGDDGCGGSCGSCGAGETCNASGTCDACTPDCTGMECGDDGCGGSCGTCTGTDTCNASGICEGCTPACDGRECGSDSCGGSCGDCDAGETCEDGTCEGGCVPDCTDRECGDDSCGGACGACGVGETCTEAGTCETCTPDCTDLNCGDDGCGGSCGLCGIGETCTDGVCEGTCVPNCTGRECGSDGCGDTCGTCTGTDTCNALGLCEGACVPNCTGRECGSDGCGDVCGTCTGTDTCSAVGVCEAVCVPDCTGRSCGGDGCGGSCGSCPSGQSCNASGACVGVTLCSAVDAACDVSTSQPMGWMCIDGPSGGTCQLACNPEAPTCAAPEICWSEDGVTGYCRGDECDSFWDNDCGAGWECVPISATTDACMHNGTATDGAACESHEECRAGSVCAGTCTAIECAPLTGTPACSAPAVCSGFALGGTDAIDLGVCITNCTPFSGTECDSSGTWCFPDFYTTGDGQCIEPGTVPEGGDCSSAACAAELICLTDDLCHAICDPTAGTGTPGACGTGEACSGLVDGDGTDLTFGYCQETCDFHAGTACTSGDTCFMAEMFGADEDVCGPAPTTLAHGANCTTAGLAVGTICGPNAGCFDVGGGDIQCLYFCATSAGAFDTVHPDCPGGEVCWDVFGEPTSGLCEF